MKSLFTNTTETTTTWITASDIENAKANLLMTAKVVDLLDNKADKYHEYAFRQFIEMDAERLANTLNQMYAFDEHLQVEVGKLAYKLNTRSYPSFSKFHNDMVAPICAFNIINSLIEINVIQSQVKAIKEVDEDSGKVSWRNQVLISFGHRQQSNDMYIAGLHQEPTLVQKKTKVRPGGKSTKLNSAEKTFLKSCSNTELRLIDIDPKEIVKYMKQSPWYAKVLSGEVNMDKIIADELIRKQVKKFTAMQKLPSFHLSMWMDYRTRLYYDIKELGFNPHGKTFETSLYELAEGRFITRTGYENLAYSAVVIVDGRMSHGMAIELFMTEEAHYLAELRKPTGDMGKDLYNSRLAQAVEDFHSETPSHFLLGEDATNGGLQHGGIGFKEPKMMIPANVGGSAHQEDSHGNLQELLGLPTRQDAKDVHQPLLHGSSLKTVAKVIGKTLPETKAMLTKAYGNSVMNIPTIAEWGTQVVDNYQTSLMWNTVDGFKAQSIAYTESVPLTLYAMSSTNKSGYTQITIHRDMPLIQDAKGQPIYGSVGEDKSQGKANKLRGLYANITHSIDAAGLRSVIRAVGESGGLWKHDNFLVHPNDMSTVREGYKAALLVEHSDSLYDSAMEQIASNCSTTPLVPKLIKGNAPIELIEESHYFLAP